MNRVRIAAVVLLTVWMAALHAPHGLAQEVFSNGVDLAGSYVISNGMIELQSAGFSQDDADTRHLGPSVGQMAGVEPDTGMAITNNGDLLTLMPRILDLSNPANWAYVMAASQIVTTSSTVRVETDGSNIFFYVVDGSIGTTNLDLTSTDARYLQKTGDTVQGDLNLNGNDLDDVGGAYFEDGTLLISAGTTNDCRFSGSNAGSGNTGANTIGIGSSAALDNTANWTVAMGDSSGRDNSGDHLVALGRAAGEGNSGSYVSSMGFETAYGNLGAGVNAIGYWAAKGNVGSDVEAFGTQAAYQNIGNKVQALGRFAGRENEGDYALMCGTQAGWGNSGDYVNLMGYWSGRGNCGAYVSGVGYRAGKDNSGSDCFFAGYQAGQSNVSDNVIAIGENIGGSNLVARSCYLDGDIRLEDCNGKGGGNSIYFHSGANIETDSSSMSFSKASKFNEGVSYVAALGDLSMGSYTNQP